MKKNTLYYYLILLLLVSACTASKDIQPTEHSLKEHVLRGIFPKDMGVINFVSHYTTRYTQEEFEAMPRKLDERYKLKPLFQEENFNKWQMYDTELKAYMEKNKHTQDIHEMEQHIGIAMLRLLNEQKSSEDVTKAMAYYTDLLHSRYCQDAPYFVIGLKTLKKEQYWSEAKISEVATRVKEEATKRMTYHQRSIARLKEENAQKEHLEWYEEREVEMLQEWGAHLETGIQDLDKFIQD